MRSEHERGKCGSSFSAWKRSKAWTRTLLRQRTMGTIPGRSGCGHKRAKCFGRACLSGRDVRAGDLKLKGNRSRRKNCSGWETGWGRSLWENTSSRPRVLDTCLLFLHLQLWINRFWSRLGSVLFVASLPVSPKLNIWRFYPTSEPWSRNTWWHFHLQFYWSGTNPLAKMRSRVHTVNILKMCVIFCKTEARGRSIESRWNFLNDKSWHESRAKQFVLLMISQSLKA